MASFGYLSSSAAAPRAQARSPRPWPAHGGPPTPGEGPPPPPPRPSGKVLSHALCTLAPTVSAGHTAWATQRDGGRGTVGDVPTAGRTLRTELHRLLPEGAEWDEAATRVLRDIEVLADQLRDIDAQLVVDGVTVRTGDGRPLAHPLLAASRQHRVTINRLIAQLTRDLNPPAKSAKHQQAARRRWANHAERAAAAHLEAV